MGKKGGRDTSGLLSRRSACAAATRGLVYCMTRVRVSLALFYDEFLVCCKMHGRKLQAEEEGHREREDRCSDTYTRSSKTRAEIKVKLTKITAERHAYTMCDEGLLAEPGAKRTAPGKFTLKEIKWAVFSTFAAPIVAGPGNTSPPRHIKWRPELVSIPTSCTVSPLHFFISPRAIPSRPPQARRGPALQPCSKSEP